MTMTAPSPATEDPARHRYDDIMDGLIPTPRQDRARRRVVAMLTAAERFIVQGGIDRFTTADVARAAGVSIGTVYRYFPDRVAILDAIRPNRHIADQQLDHALRLLAEARLTLHTLADRLDPFVYDELAGTLDDAPLDDQGRDMVALVDLSTDAPTGAPS